MKETKNLDIVCPKCKSAKELDYSHYPLVYYREKLDWGINKYDRKQPPVVKCFAYGCLSESSMVSTFVNDVAANAFDAGRRYANGEIRALIGAASTHDVSEVRNSFSGHSHCNDPRHEGLA